MREIYEGTSHTPHDIRMITYPITHTTHTPHTHTTHTHKQTHHTHSHHTHSHHTHTHTTHTTHHTILIAWSMESGEHMPDKKQFVKELFRVTAPGGRIIIVTWCHRCAFKVYIAAGKSVICVSPFYSLSLFFPPSHSLSLSLSLTHTHTHTHTYTHYQTLRFCRLLCTLVTLPLTNSTSITHLRRELEAGETKLKDREYRLLDKINDG